MPKLSPDARASQCAFTFSDGRRCRLPGAPDGAGLCSAHARKLLQAKLHEQSVESILEPLCHPKIASTNLTFVLVRLLVEVSCGRISPKLSNSLLRIIESLRKTMPDTSSEFSRTFELTSLRNTIRSLYQEHEDYIDPRMDPSPSAPPARKTPAESPAPSPQTTHPPSAPAPPNASADASPCNPSSNSPELFDFLLKGRPLSARVTPRDVDTLYHILERNFPAHESPPLNPAAK